VLQQFDRPLLNTAPRSPPSEKASVCVRPRTACTLRRSTLCTSTNAQNLGLVLSGVILWWPTVERSETA